MERRPTPEAFVSSVSNLVPVWDGVDGGGRYAPRDAATVVEQAVHAVEAGEAVQPAAGEPAAVATQDRPVAAPEPVAVTAVAPRASFYEVLATDDVDEVDYDALQRRDIAKELLRARLVSMAQEREQRSAYEIAFILLAFAVAVLLAAPPLVQVLLAARGIQA